LSDEYDRRHALKRGGGAPHVNLEVAAESLLAAAEPGAGFFDRQWALVILDNSLRAIQAECEPGLGVDRFSVLRAFLPGSVSAPTYEETAVKLGLSLPALKSELHRLRQRFKAIVRQEVANTVSAPHEIDEEIAYLQEVLMDRGHDF
jgi:RNA polymerase sigma-70 factor (ECF subfamily)